jgi:hypothetical protein
LRRPLFTAKLNERCYKGIVKNVESLCREEKESTQGMLAEAVGLRKGFSDFHRTPAFIEQVAF